MLLNFSKERRCDIGFTLYRQKCTDIDECVEYRGLCQKNIHCTNTIGSYNCGCRHGYDQTPEFGCVDIDECKNEKVCPKNSFCENDAGKFNCQCHFGYDGHLCLDIDECSEINECHSNATCSNTDGSYSCSCNSGYRGDGKACRCQEGYEGNLCLDIDECSGDNECDPNASCSNTDGSYICSCNSGYRGDGVECLLGQCNDRSCMEHGKCVSPTTETCECKDGYSFDMYNACVDIDECLLDYCDQNANCSNKEGFYDCACKTGYSGDGYFCYDVDECETDEHDCHGRSKCINTIGSFTCFCPAGTVGNGQACNDLNECDYGPHNCDTLAICENTMGSFNCFCNTGFIGDGTSCSDLNECTTDDHFCSETAKCTNTVGSYSCSCDAGVEKLCRVRSILVLNTYFAKKALLYGREGSKILVNSEETGFEIKDGTHIGSACQILVKTK